MKTFTVNQSKIKEIVKQLNINFSWESFLIINK